jgi:hypothetical protein
VTRGSQFGIVIRNVRRRIIIIIFNIGLRGSLVPRPLVEEEPVRKNRKFTTSEIPSGPEHEIVQN